LPAVRPIWNEVNLVIVRPVLPVPGTRGEAPRGSSPRLVVGSQPYLAQALVSRPKRVPERSGEGGAFRSTTSLVVVQIRLAQSPPLPRQARRHREFMHGATLSSRNRCEFVRGAEPPISVE
jgi:hypothetical protein